MRGAARKIAKAVKAELRREAIERVKRFARDTLVGYRRRKRERER